MMAIHFALADINNDGNQDLKVSYKEADRSWDITNLYIGSSYGEEDSLFSINGVNPSECTYLCKGGSIIVIEKISGTPVSYHGIMLTQKGTVSRKEQVEKRNGKAGRKTDKWERV